MWNYPCDMPNAVKTRSKTKNEPTVDYKEVESILPLNSLFIDGLWKGRSLFCKIKFVWENTIF